MRATAAPPRPDTEAIPNAARFTEQIIADEKKCAFALPRRLIHRCLSTLAPSELVVCLGNQRAYLRHLKATQ